MLWYPIKAVALSQKWYFLGTNGWSNDSVVIRCGTPKHTCRRHRTYRHLSDFLLMIERPDLRESGEFDQFAQRLGRLDEWEEVVHAFTREHSTQEIIELAQMLRIPVAPVCNGRTVGEHEQVAARGVYVEDPSGGFQRPIPPYLRLATRLLR